MRVTNNVAAGELKNDPGNIEFKISVTLKTEKIR